MRRHLLRRLGLAAALTSMALAIAANQGPVPANELADLGKRLAAVGGEDVARDLLPRLKALGKADLSASDRAKWRELSRLAALRLGDAVTLQALRQPGSVPTSGTTIERALEQLMNFDLEAASATLDRFEAGSGFLSITDERRTHSLRAKIARLEGRDADERDSVEKIVRHFGGWSTGLCQGCHGSFGDRRKLAALPLNRIWFAERYVALMAKQGDAATVRDKAERKLERSPEDEDAKIRLGYALAALGDRAGSERVFRSMPWADYPGRDLTRPEQFVAFP